VEQKRKLVGFESALFPRKHQQTENKFKVIHLHAHLFKCWSSADCESNKFLENCPKITSANVFEVLQFFDTFMVTSKQRLPL